MDQSTVVDLSAKAMQLVLLLSLPSILLATFVGLGVSLLQALTQVQEQTLSFAVRLICITVVIMITAHWMGTSLTQYMDTIFLQIQHWTGK